MKLPCTISWLPRPGRSGPLFGRGRCRLTVIEAELAGRAVVASDDGIPPRARTKSGLRYRRSAGRHRRSGVRSRALLADNARSDGLGRAGRRWAMSAWSTSVGIARTRAVYEEIGLRRRRSG